MCAPLTALVKIEKHNKPEKKEVQLCLAQNAHAQRSTAKSSANYSANKPISQGTYSHWLDITTHTQAPAPVTKAEIQVP